MARSPANRARQRPTGLLATATLLALIFLAGGLPAPAPAAGPAGDINIHADTWVFDPDGSWSLEGNVLITYGRDTRITAKRARGMDKPGDIIELNLADTVHVEFRGAILDADSALLVIRGEELLSAAVKGSQAGFSQARKDSGRRIEGSADAINYTSSNSEVLFSGATTWTDGRYNLNTDVVVYNIETGAFHSPTRGQAIRRGQDREIQDVPPPRTPERSTAQ